MYRKSALKSRFAVPFTVHVEKTENRIIRCFGLKIWLLKSIFFFVKQLIQMLVLYFPHKKREEPKD